MSFVISLVACLAVTTACSSVQSPPDDKRDSTPRIVGIGGVFFKSPNPQRLYNWYQSNLGFTQTPGEGHVNFCWRSVGTNAMARTVWGPFRDDTEYFDPGERDFMMNYRVVNLDGLLEILRARGVVVMDEIEQYPYGRFAWIIDADGNKVELWEPDEDDYPWSSVCPEKRE